MLTLQDLKIVGHHTLQDILKIILPDLAPHVTRSHGEAHVNKMDTVSRQLAVVILILCTNRKQKKIKRAWTRKWLGRRGHHGLSVLQ